MSRWPLRRMGEIAPLVRRPVKLVADGTYREIGVRSFGKGIFHKAPVTGLELGDKKVFRIEPGDLVFNIVFAWEGAVALASDQELGMIGSHRFLTCVVDDSIADARFLAYWFSHPAGREQLLRASPGGAGRNRTLGIEKLAAIEIHLPPLAEQRRIVARIEASVQRTEAACNCQRESNARLAKLRYQKWRCAFDLPTELKVGDVVRFQTGYAFKSEWFVPMGVRLARNANIDHGTLDWSETVRLDQYRLSEFSRFELQTGDILISLDRPIISTGVKVARVRETDLPALLVQRVARAEFDSRMVDPDYLFHWLQSPAFTEGIDPGRSNGVPHISHKDVERLPFFLPPLAEQRRIVAELDALQAKLEAVKALQAERTAALDALLPAILDRAFRPK